MSTPRLKWLVAFALTAALSIPAFSQSTSYRASAFNWSQDQDHRDRDHDWDHDQNHHDHDNGARQIGYEDGKRDGEHDRRGGHFRPTQHDYYKHADRGYHSDMGDKRRYQEDYRQGYDRGYREGYGRH